MAFPVVEIADTTSGIQTSNSTSWAVTLPANIALNDIIVVVTGIDGSGNISQSGDFADYAVNGFGAGDGTGSMRGALKRADGTESGAKTLTISASEQGCWRIFRVSGVHTTGTILAGGSAVSAETASGSGTGPDPIEHIPSWATNDTLWLAAAGSDHGATTYTGFPSGFGTTSAQESGGANGAALGTAWLSSAVASVDPSAFTTDASEGWGTATIAFRPAIGSASPVKPFDPIPFYTPKGRSL